MADGRIGYDPSTLAGVQQLAAGETAEDSFVYAIQLGNGTLSWARVALTVAGVNDAVEIVSAINSGAIGELLAQGNLIVS
jgi:VCBS repeat-containing protein